MNDAQIKHMVNRFLGWKLPDDFAPDAGISFKRDYNENTPWPSKHEPTGTNLFDAIQAKAMICHMLEGLPEEEGPECSIHGPICTEPCVWCRLDEAMGKAVSAQSLAQERGAMVVALRGALDELVKVNEDWNAAVEKIIGRSPNWTDGYLDRSRAALTSTADAAAKVRREILEEAEARVLKGGWYVEHSDHGRITEWVNFPALSAAILGAGEGEP